MTRPKITILRLLAASLLLIVFTPASAFAHSGAPFLVLLEEPVGPYTVTMWADPDVGGGTFTIEANENGQPLADGTTATLWAEPEDGHLPAQDYAAEWQTTADGERLVATIPFDAEGQWQVRLVMDGPAGSGEATVNVQVTADGNNPLIAAICLVPFVILGALWIVGVRRQQEETEEAI